MENYPLHKIRRRDARAHLRRMLELLATGMRWNDARRQAHLSHHTWTRYAAPLGLPLRTRGGKPRPLTRPRRARLLRLLDQGITYRRAARRLRLHPHTAADLLARPLARPAGRCPLCGRPATDNHHLLHIPEIVVSLCRSCHARWHRRQPRTPRP